VAALSENLSGPRLGPRQPAWAADGRTADQGGCLLGAAPVGPERHSGSRQEGTGAATRVRSGTVKSRNPGGVHGGSFWQAPFVVPSRRAVVPGPRLEHLAAGLVPRSRLTAPRPPGVRQHW